MPAPLPAPLERALGPHAFACFRKLGRRDSGRAMNQRQRPGGHVRNNPLGDALVVSSELNLKNPKVRFSAARQSRRE
jgi:hypothetical protein